MTKANLDQIFTRPELALSLKHATYRVLGDALPTKVLEPSVGDGAFIERGDGIVHFDLDPKLGGTLQIDAIHPAVHRVMRKAGVSSNHLLALGNVPFGKGGKAALTFVNTYLAIGGVVAFVLPLGFRRWSLQRQVVAEARLLEDWDLPFDAFRLPDGSPHEVRCCFQVWSSRPVDSGRRDHRLQKPPSARHRDFTVRRTNAQASRNAAEFPSFKHDFWVRAQGYGDYDIRPSGSFPGDERHCYLIKAHSGEALDRLLNINYERLSWTQTATPGFGLTDLVAAYV